MSGKEWQQLLLRLPDLAAKHARQRFWQLFRFWSLRIGITVLLVTAVGLAIKVALDARSHDSVAQLPAVSEPAGPDTQASAGNTPYESPNPEIRQEFFIKRDAALQNPAAKAR